MTEDRWEQGSDLHWMDPTSPSAAVYPWGAAGILYGCGRFALNEVVAKVACRRLWVPSYYRGEASPARQPRAQLETVEYRDTPANLATDLTGLAVRDGDAILVTNQLGLRFAAPLVPTGVVVIEDHTHDLTSEWAMTSRADYCFASLRKTLPVADGGVTWSPTGKPLPPQPPLEPAHASAALDRLTGILLKAAYLSGGAIDKSVFRAHALAGEQALAHGPASDLLALTRACLPGYPVEAWRATRAANFQTFARELGVIPGVTLVVPEEGAVSFMVTLSCAAESQRDELRTKLVAARIYPAVLWPLAHAEEEELDLSRRLLSLHCDYRYTPSDMTRVAHAVRRALT